MSVQLLVGGPLVRCEPARHGLSGPGGRLHPRRPQRDGQPERSDARVQAVRYVEGFDGTMDRLLFGFRCAVRRIYVCLCMKRLAFYSVSAV